MNRQEVTPGIYQHFKGKFYEVIGIAQQVDSSESFVIYRPIYGEMNLVARPLGEFVATVELGNETKLRFQKVEEDVEICYCKINQDSKSF